MNGTYSPSAQCRLKKRGSEDEDILVRPVRLLQLGIQFQQK